jgi:YfdX protein
MPVQRNAWSFGEAPFCAVDRVVVTRGRVAANEHPSDRATEIVFDKIRNTSNKRRRIMVRQRTSHNTRTLLPVGVAALGMVIVAYSARAEESAPAAPTTARITGAIQSSPVDKLNLKEWRAVSMAAGRILKNTAQARWALAEKKNDKAKSYVDKGLTLVQIIENAVPKQKVTAEIRSGDIVYKDEDEVGPALVPIYDELDHVEIIAPIVRAKKKNALALSKEEDKGGGMLEPSAETVSFEGLEYSTVKLDVLFAKGMLALAKKEITDGKTDDADNALWAIQADGVSFEFDEIALPLERAADNLNLAEVEMKEGWTDDAKVALNSASEALNEYERLAGESRSKEVKSLHKEIGQLTKSLDKRHAEQDVTKAKQKVAGWWDQVTQWFEK